MGTQTGPRLVGADNLSEAAATLRRGGLVAFPTETVYGLGADARDADAVRRVFEAKGRPADNPLIVHVADASWLPRVAREVTPLAAGLAERFWPGPLTLVLDAVPDLPAVTTGGHPTVGVRVPDHPVALALLEVADMPVAAPSANRSGRPSPTTAEHVVADLAGAVDVVVDGGACRVGVESTVVDARGAAPLVLREGAVTREDLAAAVDATDRGDAAGAPTNRAAAGAGDGPADAASPGTRYRHYAPACQVLLAPAAEVAARATTLARAGERVGAVAPVDVDLPPDVTVVARYAGVDDLAGGLYGTLRAAETAGLDVLIVATVPETGLGRAVMDRLRRAAAAETTPAGI